MNPKYHFAFLLSITLLASCSSGGNKKPSAETNTEKVENPDDNSQYEECMEYSAKEPLADSESPERMKSPYLDDEKWLWTTLLHSTPDETVFLAQNLDGRSFVVCNDNILYSNPVMRIDSIAPSVCRIHTIKGDVDIDFSRKGWRSLMAQLPQKLDNTVAYEHMYIRKGDESVMKPERDYFIRMELPDSGRCPASLNKWLVDRLCYENGIYEAAIENGANGRTQYYNGNLYDYPAIGRHLANQCFRHAPESSFKMNVYLTQDYRILYDTPNYLTYQAYAYQFWDGAHGYYTERLISYDPMSEHEIENQHLFKPGTEQAIRNLIFDAARTDDYFKRVYGDRTFDEVKSIFASNDIKDKFDIPQAGLTPEGLMFSFQPYEISGFAQGCFHILVPYEKAMPYLTNQAKSYR